MGSKIAKKWKNAFDQIVSGSFHDATQGPFKGDKTSETHSYISQTIPLSLDKVQRHRMFLSPECVTVLKRHKNVECFPSLGCPGSS